MWMWVLALSLVYRKGSQPLGLLSLSAGLGAAKATETNPPAEACRVACMGWTVSRGGRGAGGQRDRDRDRDNGGVRCLDTVHPASFFLCLPRRLH